MSAKDGEEFSAAASTRREFIAKYGAMAFAAPVIASFTLDGFARGNDHDERHHHHGQPNQCNPNQSIGNQGPPKHGQPNQCHPNQSIGNQGPPKQRNPNQCNPNQSIGDQAV